MGDNPHLEKVPISSDYPPAPQPAYVSNTKQMSSISEAMTHNFDTQQNDNEHIHCISCVFRIQI